MEQLQFDQDGCCDSVAAAFEVLGQERDGGLEETNVRP